MTEIYKALLRLYPWDYAKAFSADMTALFCELCDEQRKQGWRSLICFVTRELFGLLTGIGREWLAKFTTDESARGRHLPDLRRMRPVGVPREMWFASLGREQRRVTMLTGEHTTS